MKKLTGCYLCKWLDYYEKEGYEDSSPEGYMCNKREEPDNFKTFPCKRRLRCFESRKVYK